MCETISEVECLSTEIRVLTISQNSITTMLFVN